MANTFFNLPARVKILTVLLCFSTSGCSLFYEEPLTLTSDCKNHAYTHMVMEDYINRRYHSKSPVRVGVIPFSVPANFATLSTELPGLDFQLAQEVQRQLLRHSDLAIVEVFNRMDWPGKKDEFFTGNFGAISFGRQANYDFVIVGLVPHTSEFQEISAYAKVIEVESGITLYYGESKVALDDPEFMREPGFLWFGKDRPDKLQLKPLFEKLGLCVTMAVLDDTPEI